MDQSPKQQIVEKLKSASNVLITVSSNPSVDQLSAAIGLALMLNKLGKHATAVYSGQTPSTIDFLQPDQNLAKNADSLQDFIISLDKSKADKLRYKVEDDVVKIFITPYRTSITDADLEFSQGDYNIDAVVALGVDQREHLDEAIVSHGRILHDATVMSVMAGPSTSNIGSVNWHEPGSSSLCEMLVSISEAFQSGVLDAQMSTAFLTGIVAETERFKNQKTSPKVMTMAAQLMAAGANQQLIADSLMPPEPEPAPEPEEPTDLQPIEEESSEPEPEEEPEEEPEVEAAAMAEAKKPEELDVDNQDTKQKEGLSFSIHDIDSSSVEYGGAPAEGEVDDEMDPEKIHISEDGKLMTEEDAELDEKLNQNSKQDEEPAPEPEPEPEVKADATPEPVPEPESDEQESDDDGSEQKSDDDGYIVKKKHKVIQPLNEEEDSIIKAVTAQTEALPAVEAVAPAAAAPSPEPAPTIITPTPDPNEKTMADIDAAVGRETPVDTSVAVDGDGTLTLPDLPSADDARDQVTEAIAADSANQPPPPIQALNAQPMEEEAGALPGASQDASAPPPLPPPPVVPDEDSLSLPPPHA